MLQRIKNRELITKTKTAKENTNIDTASDNEVHWSSIWHRPQQWRMSCDVVMMMLVVLTVNGRLNVPRHRYDIRLRVHQG